MSHRRGRAAVLLSVGVLLYLAANQVVQPLSVAVMVGVGLVWVRTDARGHVSWGRLALLLAASLAVLPNLVALGACLFCLWQWRLGSRLDDELDGEDRDREAAQIAGRRGELEVSATLERDLPDGYVVLNGLLLPHGAGDIDHLVLGPTGVFLLETKTMAGVIGCDADGTWRRIRTGRGGTPYAAYIGDPTTQVERNIRSVRETIEMRATRLARSTQVWIEGLIVFAHPDVELRAERSRVPAARLADVPSMITSHVPRRVLHPRDVDQLASTLLGAMRAPRPFALQRAQAVVELALVLPLLLGLVFGVVALSRLVQAQLALVAVVEETARAGALADQQGQVAPRGIQRGTSLAAAYGLHPQQLQLHVDASGFASSGRVLASGRYVVGLDDLPALGWTPAAALSAEHEEWVDPYRSGVVR
ncbi:MAG: NERD domain-containing protein [Chloroflexi bacterium]|nr:NERD domain-containing protein [Chloroflexota bacterium]